MSLMFASDLDRTLIYSPSALQLPGEDHEAPTLVSVEVLEGRPHSFMTLATARALERLDQGGVLVPTTTRTMAQFQRVRFPGFRPRYAITSNGGNILIDGQPDASWRRHTAAAIARCAATLDEVRAELRARTSAAWTLKRRIGDDLFCYAVVDLETMPDDFITGWRTWCEARGWRVSVQGRKIYSIPGPLAKEAAMTEVAQRVGVDRVLAAGDGVLDAGFLVTADAGMRPPHGELEALGWHHPSVAIAARAGVLAAEDITEWFESELATAS